MTGDDEQPRGISRRTLTKAAAWSVPVIVLAAAAPATAASGELVYSISADESIGPNPNGDGPGTNWVIYVENTGTGPLPAGSVSITIPTPYQGDVQHFLGGYSGSTAWVEKTYGPDYDGTTRTFVYTSALLQRFNSDGSENDPYTGQLLLFFYKVPLTRTDTPIALSTVAAPPANPVQLALTIPY